jgi:hypothetical protein
MFAREKKKGMHIMTGEKREMFWFEPKGAGKSFRLPLQTKGIIAD